MSPPGITEPSRYLPRGGAAPQPTSHWTPPALRKLGLGRSPGEQAPGALRSGKGRKAGRMEGAYGGALVPTLQMRNLRSRDVGSDPPNQEVRERPGLGHLIPTSVPKETTSGCQFL